MTTIPAALRPRPAQMLCRAMRIVRRPISTSSATRDGSSASTTASAASAVMPPLPAIATPSVAVVRAGASFVPSPTIMTRAPDASRSPTMRALSDARRSPYTSSIPSVAATARAFVSWSPESSRMRRIPSRRSRPRSTSRLGRTSSANSTTAAAAPSTVTYARRPSPAGAIAPNVASAPGAPSSTQAREPTATVRPSTWPVTPRPDVSRWPAAAGSSTSRACAASTSMRASRWLDPCSTAPARPSTSFSSKAGAVTTRETRGRPAVSVPVLSKTTTSTVEACSSAPPVRTTMCRVAARATPPMIATGAARMSGQGVAITSTASTRTGSRDTSQVARQATRVMGVNQTA